MRINFERAKELGIQPLCIEIINGTVYRGIFTNSRLDSESIPTNYYKYELRDDGEDGRICEVCKYVVVNHFGTFLTETPIALVEQNGFCTVKDYSFTEEY